MDTGTGLALIALVMLATAGMPRIPARMDAMVLAIVVYIVAIVVVLYWLCRRFV